MKALLALTLADADADRVRRNHAEAIGELQATPAVGARILRGVELADGIDTPVAHGLPRAPSFVACSVPRGAIAAGYLQEVRSGTDRRSVVLRATGYGATVTVDVMVLP